MHASIWTFSGDPDDLLERFDGMLAEAPLAQMHVMIALRARRALRTVSLS